MSYWIPTFDKVLDGVSAHATTVACDRVALAIMGPSGSGKTGIATQMIAMGAQLVSDDLTLFTMGGCGVHATAPPEGIAAIELRGIGIVKMTTTSATDLGGLVFLEPSRGRLPPAETIDILNVPIPLLRHSASGDLAAKLLIWLRARALEVHSS